MTMDMAMQDETIRLLTTRTQMHEKLPPGITLIQADDFQTWLMDIQVMDDNPLYQGETYRLKFSFTPQYPIEVCLPFLSYYLLTTAPSPTLTFDSFHYPFTPHSLCPINYQKHD